MNEVDIVGGDIVRSVSEVSSSVQALVFLQPLQVTAINYKLTSYSSINLNLESGLSSRLMLQVHSAVPTNQSHNRFSALWPTEDKVRYLRTNHSHSPTLSTCCQPRSGDH